MSSPGRLCRFEALPPRHPLHRASLRLRLWADRRVAVPGDHRRHRLERRGGRPPAHPDFSTGGYGHQLAGGSEAKGERELGAAPGVRGPGLKGGGFND